MTSSTDERALHDKIAFLENRQWDEWSRHVYETGLNPARMKRWHKLWAQVHTINQWDELTPQQKESDFLYADRVCTLIIARLEYWKQASCSCVVLDDEIEICDVCFVVAQMGTELKRQKQNAPIPPTSQKTWVSLEGLYDRL